MRRNCFFGIAPLLLLLLCAFAAPEKWITHKAKNYQIDFPGQPVMDSIFQKKDALSCRADTYTYQNPGDAMDSTYVYQLMVTACSEKLPLASDKAGVKKMFDAAVQKGLNNAKGKLIAATDIIVGTYPGRDVRFSIDQGQTICTSRFILVGQQIFFLLTATSAGQEMNNTTTRFFQSFAAQE